MDHEKKYQDFKSSPFYQRIIKEHKNEMKKKDFELKILRQNIDTEVKEKVDLIE